MAEEENIKSSEIDASIPDKLTQQEALAILIQGVNVAQSKGVYSLDDAALIAKAVRTFVRPKVAEEAPAKAEAPVPAG